MKHASFRWVFFASILFYVIMPFCCNSCSLYANVHTAPHLFACIAMDHEMCFRSVLVTEYQQTPKDVVTHLRMNEWSLIHACVYYARPSLAKFLLTLNDDLRNLRVKFGAQALTPLEFARHLEKHPDPTRTKEEFGSLKRVKDVLLLG